MTQPAGTRRGRPPSGQDAAIRAAALDLLRERGIARLTTREVASRAGVSEASVYYHFGDRAALVREVMVEGLSPLRDLTEAGLHGRDHRQVLLDYVAEIERCLSEAFPVLFSAQGDTRLRATMGAYLDEHDLGPHRWVRAIADYLASEQAAGRVDPAVDPAAVGLLLVGAGYLRAAQGQLQGAARTRDLPDRAALVDQIDVLLGPKPTDAEASARPEGGCPRGS